MHRDPDGNRETLVFVGRNGETCKCKSCGRRLKKKMDELLGPELNFKQVDEPYFDQYTSSILFMTTGKGDSLLE